MRSMHKKIIFLGLWTLLLSPITTLAREDVVGETSVQNEDFGEYDGWKPNIGFRLGSSAPTHGYDDAPELGLDFMLQRYTPIGVGAEASFYTAVHPLRNDLYRTKILGKGLYNFGGSTPLIRSSYMGVNAGLVMDKISEINYGRLGWGPVAGFDIPLSASGRMEPRTLSLGANVSYLFVSNNAADDFGLNGQLKYWY